MRRLQHIVKCSAVLLLLAALIIPVAAQDTPAYEVHPDYTVRQWTVQDGLPSNTINDILQTSDGYLWLATIEGLVRYDGQQFTVYNATNTPSLASNRVFRLVESSPGRLWIKSDPGGLAHYHNGVFTRVEVEDEATRVTGILYVEGDTVWMRTDQGLARYAEGRLRPYRPDVIQQGVRALVRDSASRLWIGTSEAGLYRVDPDSTVRHFTTEDGLPSLRGEGVLLDQEGGLWAGFEGGLVRIVGDRVERIPDLQDSRANFYLDAQGGSGSRTSSKARGASILLSADAPWSPRPRPSSTPVRC